MRDSERTEPGSPGGRGASFTAVAVLACLALVALLGNFVPSLSALHADPSAHLNDPVRSLFVVSEATRRSVVAAAPWEPPWWNRCDTCSRVDAENTWRRWLESRGLDDIDGSGSGALGDAVRDAVVARDAVLAGWGDDQATQRIARLDADDVRALPAYLEERVVELRAGTFAAAEARRADRSATGTLVYRGVLVAVMLAGVVLVVLVVAGRVSSPSVEPRRLSVVTLPQGLVIVVLSLGFAHGAWPLLAATFGSVPLLWPALPALPALLLVQLWGDGRQRGSAWAQWGTGASTRSGSTLLVATVVGFALDLWLVECVDVVAWRLDWPWRWTDGVDESTFFGGASEIGVMFAEAVVVAPIVEEILFRGILFAALRRHAPFAVAALVQTLVFASLHVYSLPGLLTVAGAGVAFALVYERTGSLVPSIAAHALANASALAGAWLMR